jgi:hypothetical protein
MCIGLHTLLLSTRPFRGHSIIIFHCSQIVCFLRDFAHCTSHERFGILDFTFTQSSILSLNFQKIQYGPLNFGWYLFVHMTCHKSSELDSKFQIIFLSNCNFILNFISTMMFLRINIINKIQHAYIFVLFEVLKF